LLLTTRRKQTIALLAIERQHIGVRAETADALSISRVFNLETNDVELVCLCYLENATSAQIRYAVRRLRRKSPDAAVLVTLAGTVNGDKEQKAELAARIDFVEGSLHETVARIVAIADVRAERDLVAAKAENV
jgi:hypothetical protein